jgi:hypothetical protein
MTEIPSSFNIHYSTFQIQAQRPIPRSIAFLRSCTLIPSIHKELGKLFYVHEEVGKLFYASAP